MSVDILADFDAHRELDLYREYANTIADFKYRIETERRIYLANHVDMQIKSINDKTYFDVTLDDVWVWDFYRDDRLIKHVHLCTFKDVSIEEIG